MNHDNDDDGARLPPQSMPLAAITMARSLTHFGTRASVCLSSSVSSSTSISARRGNFTHQATVLVIMQ